MQINLRGFVTRVTDTLEFTSSVTSGHVCYQATHWGNASSIRCFTESNQQQLLSFVDVKLNDQPADVACIEVKLGEPCAPHAYVIRPHANCTVYEGIKGHAL